MATTPDAAVLGTVEHTGLPSMMISSEHAPHPADIIDTELPHRRHAVAVTEEKGLQVVVIEDEDLRANPHRAEGTRTVTDLASFLAELERRPLDQYTGTLWGNAERGQLTAIYNDHEGSDNTAEIGKDDRAAGWRDDKLTLQLKQDPDWLAWHKISGEAFRQEKFGDIVEELLHTVVRPDQADLLEIIDSVRASSKGEFESSITRANGAQRVTYNTEINAKAGRTGQLEVPQLITLRLRPWEGHATDYEVDAYFRLNINQGALALTIKLKPTRVIVRQAWEEITAGVTAAVGRPVYAQP
ncbi:DUF2303 family protein [Mycobacterium sp. C3-094]